MCEIWYAYAKSKGDLASAKTQFHGENIFLILNPMVKVRNVCGALSHGDTHKTKPL